MKKNDTMGFFITVEGGEGAGKTTLIEALAGAFEESQTPFLRTREPGGSRLGEDIRALLLQKDRTSISERAELLLFLASRAQHVQELILPSLAEGKVVLCDRFNDSTVAYQGLARGLEGDVVRRLCDFSTGGLSPDLTFYLDIDPEEGIRRVKNAAERNGLTDRIEDETMAFHRKVREGFLIIAEQEPKRFHVLDARQSKETLFNQAWAILPSSLKAVS